MILPPKLKPPIIIIRAIAINMGTTFFFIYDILQSPYIITNYYFIVITNFDFFHAGNFCHFFRQMSIFSMVFYAF